jgi:hypothetical protein
MEDVVRDLREHSVGALLELFELHVAFGEVLLTAQALAPAFREIAFEMDCLAEDPSAATPLRLEKIKTRVSQLADIADAHLGALREIKAGLDAWKLAP